MRLTFPVLLLAAFSDWAIASDEGVVELSKRGNTYRFVVRKTGREFAVTAPDTWAGNVRVLSAAGKHCGVAWPHFLVNKEGKWLTDRVESEGMKLVELKILKSSGPVISYRGTWQFRDYFTSSETHFTWYEPAKATQVHLVRTQLRILKDLEGITTTWVEFMTRENSYSTVAAMVKGGKVVTMDVSKTGRKRNMHHWDGMELADGGWITIYGSRSGQGGCAALVPLAHSPGRVRPRINNGHVDNIEIHLLDARKRNRLKKGQKFLLEYLLIAGPDRKDWKWIAPAVERARAFMKRAKRHFVCDGAGPIGSHSLARGRFLLSVDQRLQSLAYLNEGHVFRYSVVFHVIRSPSFHCGENNRVDADLCLTHGGSKV